MVVNVDSNELFLPVALQQTTALSVLYGDEIYSIALSIPFLLLGNESRAFYTISRASRDSPSSSFFQFTVDTNLCKVR